MHQVMRLWLKRGWSSKPPAISAGLFLEEAMPMLPSRSLASTAGFVERTEPLQDDHAPPFLRPKFYSPTLNCNRRSVSAFHSGLGSNGMRPHQLRQRAVTDSSTSDWDVGQPSSRAPSDVNRDSTNGEEGLRRTRGHEAEAPPGHHGLKMQLQDRADDDTSAERQPNPDAEVHSREAAVGAAGIQVDGSAGSGTTDPAVYGGNPAQGDQRHFTDEEVEERNDYNPRTLRKNLGAIRQERVTSDREVFVSRERVRDPAHGNRLGGDNSDYASSPGSPSGSVGKSEGSEQSKPKEKATKNNPRMVLDTEGVSVWALGTRVTLKVTGEETGGEYALFEYHLSPGDGSELHTHTKEDETWYMLEGDMEWLVGSSPFKAIKGSYLHLPKGIPHSYHNYSSRPAHMLVHCRPAGLEKFFLEIGQPVSYDPEKQKPANNEYDARKATESGRRYGVTFHPAEIVTSASSS